MNSNGLMPICISYEYKDLVKYVTYFDKNKCITSKETHRLVTVVRTCTHQQGSRSTLHPSTPPPGTVAPQKEIFLHESISHETGNKHCTNYEFSGAIILD